MNDKQVVDQFLLIFYISDQDFSKFLILESYSRLMFSALLQSLAMNFEFRAI